MSSLRFSYLRQDGLPLIYRTINSDQLSEAESSILATREALERSRKFCDLVQLC